MDVTEVAVACRVVSGSNIAVSVGDIGDDSESTIADVGEIEDGTVAQEIRKIEKAKRCKNNFISTINLELASLLAHLGSKLS